jgi:hypothetical protein
MMSPTPGTESDSRQLWNRLAAHLDKSIHSAPALDIERLAIEVKETDSRSRNYVSTNPWVRHGGELRCWEVDVLPAAEIEQAIDDEIGSWLDVDLWCRRDAEIEAARKLL